MTILNETASVAEPVIPKRAVLVALLALALFINYIDRGNLAIAAPLIKNDLHLTTVQLPAYLHAAQSCRAQPAVRHEKRPGLRDADDIACP